MAGSDVSHDLQKLTKEAMKVFRKHMNESFDEDDVEKMIRTTISEELKQEVEFRKLGGNPSHHKVEMAVQKLLTKDQIQNITNGFNIETFTMNVQAAQAMILRDGKKFMATIQLDSLEGTWFAILKQVGSFMVEIGLFILSCIGIRAHINDSAMRRMIEEVEPLMKLTPIKRYISEFLEGWNGARESFWGKAKAIFIFLLRTNASGILFNVFKLLIQNMTIWDKIRAMAEISAMLIVAFATDGLALIARIALVIDAAAKIVQKVINLFTLEERHNKLR